MNTKRLTSESTLAVGDKVVRHGWVSDPDAVREVIAIVKDSWGRDCYVVGPSKSWTDPGVITPRELCEWYLVLPEPRKVLMRQWYRESDGGRLPWYPQDASGRGDTYRRQGYALVEVEGTEVQS